MSGWPASSNALLAAISARHRSTSRCHFASRSSDLAVASPVGSKLRFPPVEACQRRTITSQYFGSSLTSHACGPDFARAIGVVPDPPQT